MAAANASPAVSILDALELDHLFLVCLELEYADLVYFAHAAPAIGVAAREAYRIRLATQPKRCPRRTLAFKPAIFSNVQRIDAALLSGFLQYDLVVAGAIMYGSEDMAMNLVDGRRFPFNLAAASAVINRRKFSKRLYLWAYYMFSRMGIRAPPFELASLYYPAADRGDTRILERTRFIPLLPRSCHHMWSTQTNIAVYACKKHLQVAFAWAIKHPIGAPRTVFAAIRHAAFFALEKLYDVAPHHVFSKATVEYALKRSRHDVIDWMYVRRGPNRDIFLPVAVAAFVSLDFVRADLFSDTWATKLEVIAGMVISEDSPDHATALRELQLRHVKFTIVNMTAAIRHNRIAAGRWMLDHGGVRVSTSLWNVAIVFSNRLHWLTILNSYVPLTSLHDAEQAVLVSDALRAADPAAAMFALGDLGLQLERLTKRYRALCTAPRKLNGTTGVLSWQ